MYITRNRFQVSCVVQCAQGYGQTPSYGSYDQSQYGQQPSTGGAQGAAAGSTGYGQQPYAQQGAGEKSFRLP